MFFRSVTQLILNPLVRAVEVKNSDQVDQLVLFRCTIWMDHYGRVFPHNDLA